MLVAFVWELTKETIHLPLGCLQGGNSKTKAQVPSVLKASKSGFSSSPLLLSSLELSDAHVYQP